MNKHLGKIYDGRWEVIKIMPYSTSHGYYCVLRNIYNQSEITITKTTLHKIESGETTVSKVMRYKIKRRKEMRRYD